MVVNQIGQNQRISAVNRVFGGLEKQLPRGNQAVPARISCLSPFAAVEDGEAIFNLVNDRDIDPHVLVVGGGLKVADKAGAHHPPVTEVVSLALPLEAPLFEIDAVGGGIKQRPEYFEPGLALDRRQHRDRGNCCGGSCSSFCLLLGGGGGDKEQSAQENSRVFPFHRQKSGLRHGFGRGRRIAGRRRGWF